ncbi:NAD-dependent protein deacetylase HST1-like protein isoform X1 [Tasmannia lanceolata]|uniref:NAD-dependent protein deacetylase HST1-like protein isoform X1 n=1 Tax=Tasmannia lanceolata TaxID=3420 RepID=UPI00406488F9
MKIFNWMHRKLHQNVDYCMVSCKKDVFAEDGKEEEKITCDGDTESLLLHDHVTLVNVLDGWPDGILKIGTFGLDFFQPQEEYSVQGEEYSVQIEDEEEELNPLAVEAINQELEKIFASSHDGGHVTENEISKPCPTPTNISDNLTRRLTQIHESNDYMEKKKGKRTTLADLFLADVAAGAGVSIAENYKSGGTAPESDKKPAFRTKKHVTSLAKKLVPWKGEDSPPSRKLHRLIRRILKRKIHPEFGHEIHGGVSPIDPSKIPLVIGKPGFECCIGVVNFM